MGNYSAQVSGSHSGHTKDTPTVFEKVADLEVINEANVHGIIANVSPVKKGTTPYFDAKLCDEEKQVRVVGFSSTLRKRLASFQDTMDPNRSE